MIDPTLTLEFVPEGKRCYSCKLIRPRGEFTLSSKTRDGLERRCRRCQSIQFAMAEYGISREEAERLRSVKSCQICGTSDPGGHGSFHIDHDGPVRTKGERARGYRIRGVLCASCNLGLGHFGHDPERLRRAIGYLEGARR